MSTMTTTPYERVTYRQDGRTRTIYLHRPTVGGHADGLLGEFLTGIEVNIQGDEVAPRGVDERRHIISLELVTKRIPMVMDNIFGELTELEL